MCDVLSDEKKIEFLKDAIIYLEGRINLVDNKASVLIAIQGGLFVLAAYLTKQVFQPNPSLISDFYRNILLFILFIGFLVTILTISLLIQTIRPSKYFFSLGIPLKKMKVQDYLLWPGKEFPWNPEKFKEKINSLDNSKIRANYERLYYITAQLVRKKYNCYKWAVLGLKMMTLIILGLGLFSLCSIY